MATDNWQHRSAGMTCATCIWFVRFDSDFCGDHKLDEAATPPVAAEAQAIADRTGRA